MFKNVVPDCLARVESGEKLSTKTLETIIATEVLLSVWGFAIRLVKVASRLETDNQDPMGATQTLRVEASSCGCL